MQAAGDLVHVHREPRHLAGLGRRQPLRRGHPQPSAQRALPEVVRHRQRGVGHRRGCVGGGQGGTAPVGKWFSLWKTHLTPLDPVPGQYTPGRPRAARRRPGRAPFRPSVSGEPPRAARSDPPAEPEQRRRTAP